MAFADPGAQSTGSTGLHHAATDAAAVSRTVGSAAAEAAGACGDGPVGPAIERFAAAWGGELVAWALSASTLSDVAAENGRQMTEATGG
jgi:hypothetical protein